MLNIIEFIRRNKDWEEKLSDKPFCLKIKRKDGYIMFNYNQIDSNFSNPIVREARGIIFREKDFKPVCVPFFKFFNYGEGHADSIDWKTARILDKVDGSIIKVWHDKKWHVSTNGTIDAFDAPVSVPMNGIENFGQLFMDALRETAPAPVYNDFINGTDEVLNSNSTHIFELVSPITRVVLEYPKNKLFHIGNRNNNSLMEYEYDLGIEKPASFKFNSLEDCINAAQSLSGKEGFVDVDADYHRVKIKSVEYLNLHHLKGEGVMTKKRALALIDIHEDEEYLATFKEYIPIFNEVKSDLEVFKKSFENAQKEAENKLSVTRKEFADWVSQYILKTGMKHLSSFLFEFYTKRTSWEEFYKNLDSEKKHKYIYRE